MCIKIDKLKLSQDSCVKICYFESFEYNSLFIYCLHYDALCINLINLGISIYLYLNYFMIVRTWAVEGS